MLIDRTGEIAETWRMVETDAPIPWHGPVIVPFERLEEALSTRAAAGVAIANDTDTAALAPYLPRLGLISVAFPSFADGRGFSVGRRLRDLGFEGRLRATGPVIADQFGYLLACGFDEVDVPNAVSCRQPVDQWLAQLSKVTLAYQRRNTGRRSILDSRLDR